MSPLSTLGKAKEPLSGEEHRDADTPLLQSRLATTTPENAPSNPEASYPRADPSTPHGGGIRRIASCIRGAGLLGSPGRRSSFVAGRVVRRILAVLVGFWFVGSSPTVVGCVGALELGIPVPFHGLRAPQVRVGQVPVQTLTPSLPILRGWRVRIKAG